MTLWVEKGFNMISEYQRGRRDALREIGDIFAEEADAAQRKIRESIRRSRKARSEDNDDLTKKYDSEMRLYLNEKVAYMKALMMVMEFTGALASQRSTQEIRRD